MYDYNIYNKKLILFVTLVILQDKSTISVYNIINVIYLVLIYFHNDVFALKKMYFIFLSKRCKIIKKKKKN